MVAGLQRQRAPMKINGTASVSCPVCGTTADYPLVQMVNPAADPASKALLLAGELNVAVCSCGKRTQLAANVVYHDPEAKIVCHVCPEGEAAMQRAEQAFAASFAGAEPAGLQRIVPSLNALVEKLKIAEAGLQDWAIEMTKVLLLASISVDDDDRVMLFVRADEEEGRLHWLLFDPYGELPAPLASPLVAYHRLVATSGGGPPAHQRLIDRAWAIEAVRQMIARAN
jgi:CpXC protein